jgi:hypothetical protein
MAWKICINMCIVNESNNVYMKLLEKLITIICKWKTSN